MTAEVDYLLERLEATEAAQPDDHPLVRINRDDSKNVTDDTRDVSVDLTRANIVSVGFDSDNPSVRGNEYNVDNVVTCQIRVVGLDHSEYGHVDPAGENGVPWRDIRDANGDVTQRGLIGQITDRIYADRTYPAVPGPDVYHHIEPIDETDLSSDAGDEHRTVLTVPFKKVQDF